MAAENASSSRSLSPPRRSGPFLGLGRTNTLRCVREDSSRSVEGESLPLRVFADEPRSGAYGLLLDSSFSRNSSATCPTFDNEVLCTSEAIISERAVPFDCIGLEVWGT